MAATRQRGLLAGWPARARGSSRLPGRQPVPGLPVRAALGRSLRAPGAAAARGPDRRSPGRPGARAPLHLRLVDVGRPRLLAAVRPARARDRQHRPAHGGGDPRRRPRTRRAAGAVRLREGVAGAGDPGVARRRRDGHGPSRDYAAVAAPLAGVGRDADLGPLTRGLGTGLGSGRPGGGVAGVAAAVGDRSRGRAGGPGVLLPLAGAAAAGRQTSPSSS